MLTGSLLKFVTLATISTIAMAHSRLSSPVPRDPNAITGGSSYVLTVNCEYVAGPHTSKATYQRGQQIDINWARNNHVGGFIRLSVVPLASSDQKGIFDIEDNIEQLHCHESGCGSGDPLNYPGMLGGDPPGKNQPFQNMCTKKFTIPAHLPDGSYTLQWLWYGAGAHYGNPFQMEGDYKSCHDFTVSGGAPVKAKPTGTCPVYKGGDIHQKGDKCIYLYETKPETCTVSPNTDNGDILWDCGGKTDNLTYTFGYPYPDLYKSCTKPSKKRSLRRHLDGESEVSLNFTGSYGDRIKVVKGLEKYYR